MSRHQLPGNHGNPLTLADGLRSKDSQEIRWECCGGGGGRKVGVTVKSIRVVSEKARANKTLSVKGWH